MATGFVPDLTAANPALVAPAIDVIIDDSTASSSLLTGLAVATPTTDPAAGAQQWASQIPDSTVIALAGSAPAPAPAAPPTPADLLFQSILADPSAGAFSYDLFSNPLQGTATPQQGGTPANASSTANTVGGASNSAPPFSNAAGSATPAPSASQPQQPTVQPDSTATYPPLSSPVAQPSSAPSSYSGSDGPSNIGGSGTAFSPYEGGLAVDQPLSPGGVNAVLHGVEGVALSNVTTTTFNDADPNATVNDFGAPIDWGDGTTGAGTVGAAAGGGFNVTGSHTYTTVAAFTVTTTITDLMVATPTDFTTINGTATAEIADAPLTASPAALGAASASAGTAANVTLATFTDPNPTAAASDYQANIDWGDGSTSTGTVSAANGGFAVAGSHTYAQAGNYQAVLTLATSDSQSPGGTLATVTSTVQVSDPNLAAGAVSVTPNVEGADSTLVAAFTDGQQNTPSAYQTTIDWGDGNSGAGTVAYANGGFSVNADHTYLAAGTYTATVTISDAYGDTVVETGTAIVPDAPLSATGATAYAAQNAPTALTVAAFTDANSNASASDFTAMIAWGDGSSDAGVVAGASGDFTVSGSHVYTQAGTFAPVVTIQDVSSSATATGSVIVSTVSAAAQPVSFAEATSATVTLATFSDSQPGPDTAVIDWGDGTPTTAGVVSGASGNYSVSGTHTYAVGGANLATVTITNAAGLVSVLNVAATVTDAPLTATGTAISAAQGVDSVAVVVATFTDANPNATTADFGASIDWGDGSSGDSFATVTQTGNTFSVTGDHTYLSQGAFTVTTTITQAGGAVTVATSTATVGVGPITATAASLNATGGVAASSITVATFTGTAAVTAAAIDWGDGSTPTSGVVGNGVINGDHTYAASGTYTVNVTLTDANGDTAATASTAVVANPVLSAGSVTVPGSTEGQAFSSQIATFTDADANAQASDFFATITWGDDTTTAGTVNGYSGNFTVSGGNTYYEAGSYPVTVTVTDKYDASIVMSGGAVVADATIQGTVPDYLAATVGNLLSGITLATFTDSYAGGLASDYTASIDWGDGTTTAGVVAGSDGTFSVDGSHTYGNPNTYTIQVTLVEASVAATVSEAVAVQPHPVYELATGWISGPNAPSVAAATVDWGDGTGQTPGTLSITGPPEDENFTVTAPHSYAEEGTYPVTVTLLDGNGAALAAFGAVATVFAAPMQAAAPPPPPPPPVALPAALIQHEQFYGPGVEAVAKDSNGTNYHLEWDAGLPAAKESPIANVRGTPLEFSDLRFSFAWGRLPPGLAGPISAIGTVTGPGVPTGMTIAAQLVHDGPNGLASGGSAISNIFFDRVTEGLMTIHWQLVLANGQKLDAGTASNYLYVPYKAKYAAKPLYQTVLDTGSKYNGGAADTENSVIANAWAVFTTLEVPRNGRLATDPDRFLKYYGLYNTHNKRTDLLLAGGDGNCIAWSKFLIDVLEAQGIHQKDWNYPILASTTIGTAPNGAPFVQSVGILLYFPQLSLIPTVRVAE